MNKDNAYEYGQVYKDPTQREGRGAIFKTAAPRPAPSIDELNLKVHRSWEDGYDPYGSFDPKLRTPSFARTIRRIKAY